MGFYCISVIVIIIIVIIHSVTFLPVPVLSFIHLPFRRQDLLSTCGDLFPTYPFHIVLYWMVPPSSWTSRDYLCATLLGCSYIEARTDTTQQSGQTPDKEVEMKNITVYVNGYTERPDTRRR